MRLLVSPQWSRGHSSALLPALLACLLAAIGCGSTPPVERYVAELVPFAEGGVDTDLIFPRESGASRFLVRNWPPMRSVTGNSVWLFGSWAHIGFFAIADEPPALVAEARPFAHPDAPVQLMSVLINGVQIEVFPMPRRWETYEIPLPREQLEVGWNEIELRFSESYVPADYYPESEDRRTLAAEFRRIEMRGAAGRPYWADRPDSIRLTRAAGPSAASPAANPEPPSPGGHDEAPDTSLDAAATFAGDPADIAIEMPADSFLDAYLVPANDGGLTGSASVAFAPQGSGRIRASVDVLEADRSTEVWSAELTPQSPSARVSADLSAWGEQVVALRLRVYGDANGVVSWEALGITGSTAPDAALAPAEFDRPPASGSLGRPDVLLIILDAARADRFLAELGSDLAPNIQQLAADGTVFTRAWAPSSWTGQSIPAIWSGVTPDTAGIEHWGSRLPLEVTTFPELFLEAGYHTVLWSQHNIYRARPMLRNGFEVFAEVDSADITQRVILPEIADIFEDGNPNLGIVHLLPPHDPYEPPEPFLGTRSGWYEGPPINARVLNQYDDLFPTEDPALRDEVRRAAMAKYEENVQFADHLVGRLVDDLRVQGRYDDALVIVTADHGEAFYEHERFLHTSHLFEEYVHVPLVIKWPSSFRGFVARVDTPVSLLDLAPTLIDGLGINDERASYQGRTLLPLASGGAAADRILYAYTSGETDPEKEPKPKYALRWRNLKLLHDARRNQPMLFRLDTDPAELENISLEEGFYSAWLRQTLQLARAHNAGFLLQIGGAQVEDLDEESVRRLRALGYLR